MKSTHTSVAIVCHSGFGHTRVQAEAVRSGAASVDGTEVHLIGVDDIDASWDRLDPADGSPEDLNRLAGFLGAMAQSNADIGPMSPRVRPISGPRISAGELPSCGALAQRRSGAC